VPNSQNIARRNFLVGTTMGIASASIFAAEYPTHPVKIVVPWPAGGGGDVVVRLIVPAVSELLGQSIVVENRPGASGSIGSALVSRASPDGYTLLFANADSHSIAPHVLKGARYDPDGQFVAIAPIGQFPFGLVVNPRLPANNLKEFISFAKSSRPPITFGTWGIGSSGHILCEMLKSAASIDLLHVPYQGTAPLVTALLSGEVAASLLPLPLVEQHVRSGGFRLLAVTTPQRIDAFASTPTFSEEGLQLGLAAWTGIVGPAGIPPSILGRLRTVFGEAMKGEQVQQALRKLFVVPDARSGQEFGEFIRESNHEWGRAIAKAKIAPQ